MATGLIESLTMPFTPERFENEYRKALLERIEAKIAGAPPEELGPAPEQGRVVDLMEALRASIQAAEGRRGADEPPRRTIPGLPGAPPASVPGVPPVPADVGPDETVPGRP